MAKNLVDENDHHLDNENRFYLFVSPSPMNGKQRLDLHEANVDIIAIAKRLFDVYTGQSTFRDWIQAQTVNEQIDRLDQSATGLEAALQDGRVNPATLLAASQQIVAVLYSANPGIESQSQALVRLSTQYAKEVATLGGTQAPAAEKANAFLFAILALEKAAGLGERDRMQIYGIVTEDGKLAGAGIFAFLGFFDQSYRDHDYDWGRTVAQQLLANPAFSQPGQLGPIRYTPAPIRPINTALNGLPLNQVPSDKVDELKSGLTDRFNEILKDKLSNPIERYPAQLGADLVLKLLIDYEFSR